MRYDDRTDFNLLFAELAKRSRTGRWEPNADVFYDEASERVIVNVEAAGADPDSLRIGIDGRHLFIIGRRVQITRFGNGSFLQKEIEYGEFVKKIHLPMAVHYEDVSATYRDGILRIHLPVASSEYMPTSRTEIRMTIKRTLA